MRLIKQYHTQIEVIDVIIVINTILYFSFNKHTSRFKNYEISHKEMYLKNILFL